ncbi:MAG TPA: POTRA domain-containing protein [Thermotogota bacterium]|nr:POTRA domain-containing protein [Thermotogota bacterium]
MKSKRNIILLLSLLLLIGSAFSIKIGLLEIKGNLTIETEEIIQVLTKCQEGSDINYADIERDIFNIKDMGYFQDVKYYMSDYVGNSKLLTIEVIEYPMVNEVELSVNGPELLKQQALEDLIMIEKGKALNYKKLIRTQNSIKNEFLVAGYQLIEIRNNIENTSSGVNLPGGNLRISVIEYGLYDFVLQGEFGDISYEEVKELLDLKYVKDYVQDFWKLFLLKKNYYPSNSTLQLALSRLFNTGLISSETNIDFENFPEPLESGEYVTNLVIDLKLNPVVPENMPINSMTIQGNTLIVSSELTKNLRSTYETQTVLIDVLRDAQRIKAIYENAGYPMIVVTPRYDSQTGELVFKISEGFIADYKIQGLTKTREDLVRREIAFETGDAITLKDLQQTYVNLNKTGYFGSINLEPLGLSANSTAVTILINLKELENNIEFKTNVTFDPKIGGESFIQNIYGKIGLGLKNPMGQGQSIDVSTTLGKYPSIGLGYSVASVFSSSIDAGIDITYGKNFNSKTLTIDNSTDTANSTTVTYESEDFTIKPNMSYRIDDFQTIGTDFTWGRFKNYNYSTDNASLTDQISTEGITSIWGVSYQYDTRDNYFSPNYGLLFKTRADYSLPFDFVTEHWFKIYESISGYWSPFENHVLAGRFISAQIPWEEGNPINYTIGGSNNMFIRGIAYARGISVDYVSALNLEYRYKFVNMNSLGVEFAAFSDNAFGWDEFTDISNSKLYSSIGFGVRFNIPGFGVLRLDIPWDISPSLWGNDGPQWGGISFAYGQMF